MEKSYLKTLELEKILEQAIRFAVCEEARTRLLEAEAFETV